ncbi:polysaccharide deacetylase family protein [Ruoffia tabacinasalis]|uniref:Polysaccharide deacetylase family protein n=1 Tax=Ruoffia tabacinasalis TaxID=87458 RepID=A0A5R9DUX3_9LACT|nr:polysaccharide deacetylase family protein [Ruoffia tabacinasalis]TLQ39632.1 polysaccharide deacetylase family protein [Ruoffia tabacinasalis]
MQKVFLKVLLGTVLLGNMPTHSWVQAEEIPEDIPQIEITEEAVPTDYNIVKSDNVRAAWTDYGNYAQPDEEGYAYYIHADPDISSEIFPLDENSSEDVLLFTFDDAPQEPDSYAIEMAQVMKEKDVNAIFLVNGMYLESEWGREITKQVHDMGFEIGNHTHTHPNLRELTYEEQYNEIVATNQMVEEITGAPVRWFRPPFGLFNMDTILICNELGLQLMTWSFGYDWMDEYLSGPELAAVSLDNMYTRPGANILMHDRSWTLEALPTMIDGYSELGYHIVDPYLIQHQENSTEPL